jgi:hypothetical protein
MTQAGYLSSHFYHLIAIAATARAIKVRGDPNFHGALTGRMLPIRPRLFENQLLLIYGSSEGWACPLTHLLALDPACCSSCGADIRHQDQGTRHGSRQACLRAERGVTGVTDGLCRPGIQ